MTTILSILFFILSVSLVVYVRTRNNGKYEIKLSDIIVSLIPIVLWFLLNGQILELQVGDLKVKLKEAYQKPILGQITSLVEGREIIAVGVNCTHGKEDDILDEKTFPSYRPFKYILIEDNCEDDKNGNSEPTFWGIITVDDYKEFFIKEGNKTFGGAAFLEWVKAKNAKQLKEVVPSFLSLNDAINYKTNKLTALEQMEKLKTDILPVIDDKQKFLGFIERSRLSASFLLEIGNTLNSK